MSQVIPFPREFAESGEKQRSTIVGCQYSISSQVKPPMTSTGGAESPLAHGASRVAQTAQGVNAPDTGGGLAVGCQYSIRLFAGQAATQSYSWCRPPSTGRATIRPARGGQPEQAVRWESQDRVCDEAAHIVVRHVLPQHSPQVPLQAEDIPKGVLVFKRSRFSVIQLARQVGLPALMPSLGRYSQRVAKGVTMFP